MSSRIDSSTEAVMNAVVLYDEFASGRRAKAYFDGLTTRSNHSVEVSINLWRFDVLVWPNVAEAALSEAADADLMGIAIRRDRSLPGAVVEWLEAWVVSRAVPDAALVLIQDGETAPEPETSPAQGLLRKLADDHRLRFLSPGCLDSRWQSRAFTSNLWRREHLVTTTLQNIISRPAYEPHTHWGINE